MILSDTQIRLARNRGNIEITPFDENALGPNSYDVHLGDTLVTYRVVDLEGGMRGLDVKHDHDIYEHKIPGNGFTLVPNRLYLASTVEYTETRGYIPYLDGKSSIGRLGITIHCTAGRGDNGFRGHWTLEVYVIHPVRIYAGMPIAQLTYHDTMPAAISYADRASSKYNNHDPKPQSSRMWKNFRKDPP